jgi:ribonuclease BN (tRNA processing enzyme)
MSVKVTFVGSGDAFGTGGRFQTCILIDAPGIRFVIDFGASSLIALNKLEIPHNSIDAIVLTHIHADHSGGIALMLMDAMLGAKRRTPLTIAGPVDTKARLGEMGRVLMPGSEIMVPKFPLDYIEMETLREHTIRGLKITTYPADHTRQTNPTCVRIEVAGKVIAYTGDGDWTEHTPMLADGADLLIAECYYYKKPIRFHLNYPTIKSHWSELKAKRIILTHLASEMFENKDLVPEECAYDGLVINV